MPPGARPQSEVDAHLLLEDTHTQTKHQCSVRFLMQHTTGSHPPASPGSGLSQEPRRHRRSGKGPVSGGPTCMHMTPCETMRGGNGPHVERSRPRTVPAFNTEDMESPVLLAERTPSRMYEAATSTPWCRTTCRTNCSSVETPATCALTRASERNPRVATHNGRTFNCASCMSMISPKDTSAYGRGSASVSCWAYPPEIHANISTHTHTHTHTHTQERIGSEAHQPRKPTGRLRCHPRWDEIAYRRRAVIAGARTGLQYSEHTRKARHGEVGWAVRGRAGA